MFCRWCGVKLGDGARFCGSCGKREGGSGWDVPPVFGLAGAALRRFPAWWRSRPRPQRAVAPSEGEPVAVLAAAGLLFFAVLLFVVFGG